jgi:hypothetical protein
MRVSCARSAAAMVAAVAIAACGGGPLPLPTRQTGLLALPSISIYGEGCPGVGLGDDAVLAGNPDDPRVAWVEQQLTHGRVEVVFPSSLGARFTPALEIVDPSGEVIARAGDHIAGGCGGGGGPVLILWPYR